MKQTLLQIVIPQVFEANASSSDGIHTLIGGDINQDGRINRHINLLFIIFEGKYCLMS